MNASSHNNPYTNRSKTSNLGFVDSPLSNAHLNSTTSILSTSNIISLCTPSDLVPFRLSYISRATRVIPAKEIADIVSFAQRNNARLNVTGALVTCGDLFLQTLEGDKTNVMSLYKKIEKDDRHTNCVIINTESAEEFGMQRKYNGWAMENIYLKESESVLHTALNTMLQTVVESHYLIEAYTQKSVLKMIREGVDPRTKPIEKVNKVIMFSDICSYTTITESKPIEYIHHMLNRYYSIMDDHISDQKGEVSKLLGDGLMASFAKEDCVGAVHAAIGAILELKKSRHNKDFENLEAGIGLSCGEIIEGSFGSNRKLDFTYISDVCNRASRLEGKTRETGHSILFDENVYLLVKDHFPKAVFVDSISVKGKKEKVKVYTIDDPNLRIELPAMLNKENEVKSEETGSKSF